VSAIEALGYVKTLGNQWTKVVDDRRRAVIDLLVPAYTSRARDTFEVGTVVTTEVPGLAEAFRRPGMSLDVALRLQDGTSVTTSVLVPDAVGMLALKSRVRAVRDEERDALDIWRCLEVAAADGVTPTAFENDEPLEDVRRILWREVGPNGIALEDLTAGLQDGAAARLRTRLRALLVDVVGQP
jgi:hypothetical protein